MNLVNLKRVDNYRVVEWIEKKIPELTPYQKERIRDDQIIRLAPFYFFERRKKTSNILLRLSIIFMIPVLIMLLIGLPFNFFITGSWGYNYERIKWYSKWVGSCGL